MYNNIKKIASKYFLNISKTSKGLVQQLLLHTETYFKYYESCWLKCVVELYRKVT